MRIKELNDYIGQIYGYANAEAYGFEPVSKPEGISEEIIDKCVQLIDVWHDYHDCSLPAMQFLINHYGELNIDSPEDVQRFSELFTERKVTLVEIEKMDWHMSALTHKYAITCVGADEVSKRLSWLQPTVLCDGDIQFDRDCSIGCVCHALSNCYPDRMIVGREAGTEVFHVWKGGLRIEY